MEIVQVAQIQYLPVVVNVMKVLTTGLLAFMVAFVLTPLWTYILYRYRLGIRIKETSVDGKPLTYVSNLHGWKAGTPTMGGVIVWISVLVLIYLSQFLFPIVARWVGINFIARLDFLNRSETWLPLFTLVTAGVQERSPRTHR